MLQQSIHGMEKLKGTAEIKVGHYYLHVGWLRVKSKNLLTTWGGAVWQPHDHHVPAHDASDSDRDGSWIGVFKFFY